MTLTLNLPLEVEGILLEAARRLGKTPEQLAAETLRSNFSSLADLSSLGVYPTARQLLAMPEAERGRLLSEAAAHAAPLYEADLALPPEQRELTAISAVDDNFYDYSEKKAHG